MTSTRGLSGATVFVVGDEAIKVAYDQPNKVVAQGEWLAAHSGKPHLPKVHAVLKTGYAMERLDPIPTSEVDLELLLEALDQSVWSQPGDVEVDTPQTMLYVTKILESFAPALLHPVLEVVSYIHASDPCTMTHGDPTAENVMLRGDTYVLIDPIPAAVHVPNDIAVDVGKVLQSAHGWEEMKGEERASFTPDDVAKYVTPELFELAERWTVVHFVRTLPYATEEVRERVVEKVAQLLGV